MPIKYVLDLYRLVNQSEIRVGAADARAQIHVLDLIPASFEWKGGRHPYIPAEGLHGRWRSALDLIFANTEANWRTHETISQIFGNPENKTRGRLRFSHAFPGKLNWGGFGVWKRLKLFAHLGTVENLFDELVVDEGLDWWFTRIYRGPDKQDDEITEDLNILDRVDQAINSHWINIGAGQGIGRGLCEIRRKKRIFVKDDIDYNEQCEIPSGTKGFVPRVFHSESFGLNVLSDNLGSGEGRLLLCRIRNLGQVEPGRELISGTKIFGALAALALELDGTLPAARISSSPEIVDLKTIIDPENPKYNGLLFSRLYRAWKDSAFRIAPFLPWTKLGDLTDLNNAEDPWCVYNKVARQAYTSNNGFRYYDSRILHIHAARNRDTGATEKSFHTTETRAGQDFIGLVLLKTEAVAIFKKLLPLLPLADIGHSKHTVIDFEIMRSQKIDLEGAGPGAQDLQGTPKLITRKLDGYCSETQNNGNYFAHYWTGAFPTCWKNNELDNGKGGKEFKVNDDGWAVPIVSDVNQGRRFAVTGTPCWGDASTITIKNRAKALVDGVCDLKEWNCLGYGQVVFLDDGGA